MSSNFLTRTVAQWSPCHMWSGAHGRKSTRCVSDNLLPCRDNYISRGAFTIAPCMPGVQRNRGSAFHLRVGVPNCLDSGISIKLFSRPLQSPHNDARAIPTKRKNKNGPLLWVGSAEKGIELILAGDRKCSIFAGGAMALNQGCTCRRDQVRHKYAIGM